MTATSDLLTQARAHNARLSKLVAKGREATLHYSNIVASCEKDEEALAREKAIDPLDEKAVDRRALREMRAQVKRRAIPVAQETLDVAIEDLRLFLLELCRFMPELFKGAFSHRMEQIASGLAPLYDDPGRAKQAATQTDAARSARLLAFERWNLALNIGGTRDFELLSLWAAEFAKALGEATRDGADLVAMLQFSPRPTAQTPAPKQGEATLEDDGSSQPAAVSEA